jgi:hypothetical protein
MTKSGFMLLRGSEDRNLIKKKVIQIISDNLYKMTIFAAKITQHSKQSKING